MLINLIIKGRLLYELAQKKSCGVSMSLRKFIMIISSIILIGILTYYAHPLISPRWQIEKHYNVNNLEVRDVGIDCLPSIIVENSLPYMDRLSERDYKLADDGIIMHDLLWRNNFSGWQKSPFRSSMFGMSALRSWCERGDKRGLAIALRHADWLVETAIIKDGFAVWYYPYPNTYFQAEAGWTSGLGNARAIIFLTQTYHITKDPDYAELIHYGLNGFAVEMENGGVIAPMNDGESIFFEEVAQPGIEPAHILNGHLIALEGLAYAGDYFDDPQALVLFEQGADSVANYSSEFDTGNSTYYSLGPGVAVEKPVTHYAHRLHTLYSIYLYNRTGNPIFRNYANRWAGYVDGWSIIEEEGELILKR